MRKSSVNGTRKGREKAADLRWLSEGFEYAGQVHAKGVMIIWQADLNFSNEQHLTNPHDFDALADYADALRTQTEAFDGQVAIPPPQPTFFSRQTLIQTQRSQRRLCMTCVPVFEP